MSVRALRISTPGAARRLLVVVVCAGAAVGCGPSDERLEADRIGHAIDVLRNAPAHAAEGRMSLVEDLEKQPAKQLVAVNARDACALAYRRLEEATTLEGKVRKGVEGGELSPALLQELAEAEKKVKEAKEAMPACEAALADLRRAFGSHLRGVGAWRRVR